MADIIDLRTRNEIETEASAWIVQLHDKKPTDHDLRELSEWMARSAYHREAFIRLFGVWNDANVLTALLDDLAVRPQTQREPARRRAPRIAPWAAALSSLAIVVFAAVSLWRAADTAEAQRVFQTALGEQNEVSLADGSAIRLNTSTLLHTDYSPSERAVHLHRGEALFDVAPDPARPFVVYVGDNVVRAVGTAFSVRLKGDEIELLVSEGRVEVAHRGDPSPTLIEAPKQLVEALETATLSDGVVEIAAIDEERLSRSLAWRRGQLVFKGETLDTVVAEITRYTPTEFVFEDPSLRDIRIGGLFQVGEVDGLLIALEGSFGVEVRRDADGRVVLADGGIN